MRTLIEFLVQFILSLTGAVGFAIAMVGGSALLGGCALMGGSYCWRRWRGAKPEE